jgi:hypothetical protein
MPHINDISYSRDECISTIRDYYAFLTKMYLDESDVLEPPEDGWPAINSANMEGFGKSDEVISLLRRLPYINSLDDAEGAGCCRFADWQLEAQRLTNISDYYEDMKICSESDYEYIPPQVIGLTFGGRDNPIILLDTSLGVVYWPECTEEIRGSPSTPEQVFGAADGAPENEVEWREEGSAWAIADFFEILKNRFRELHYVPTSPKRVRDTYFIEHPSTVGRVERVQNIYREHGWPNLEQYHKQDCMREVKKLIDEHFEEVP